MTKRELFNRYKVISEMGFEWIEEAKKLFEKNNGKALPNGRTYGYFETVRDAHANFLKDPKMKNWEWGDCYVS